MEPGTMANRENALPELNAVYIEKFSDTSTPALFKVSFSFPCSCVGMHMMVEVSMGARKS